MNEILEAFYAVFALTVNPGKNEVQEILNLSIDEEVKKALDQNRQNYGSLPEDWKPFNNVAVKDLIQSKGHHYISRTIPIYNAVEHPEQVPNLRKVMPNIFFVDPYTCYLPRYQELAARLDLLVSCSHSLFVLIHSDIDARTKKKLESEFTRVWPAASKAIADAEDGSLHHIALRADNLKALKDAAVRYFSQLRELHNQISLPNNNTSVLIANALPHGTMPSFSK